LFAGEEAYHADCFRCVQCGNKIEDLVFTQTSKVSFVTPLHHLLAFDAFPDSISVPYFSQGIFCTACHEIRKQLKLKRKEDKSRKTASTEYAINKQLPQIPNPPSHVSVSRTHSW
jgi:LIM domain